MTEEKIKELLCNEYNSMTKKFGKHHILGTFTIGKANYGMAATPADVRFVSIYIPSFEDLCIGNIHSADNLYDIRTVYNIAMDHSCAPLELLFSRYYIITEKYETVYKNKFYNHREEIGRFCDYERLSKAHERAAAAVKEGNIVEAVRLYQAAYLYTMNAPCEECFHPSNPLNRMAISAAINSPESIDTDEILNKMNDFVQNASTEQRFAADEYIKQGVISVISYSLENNISVDSFISCLTQTEKIAFKNIIFILSDGIDVISISQIVEDTGISRPVYKNLLLKMENNKIAEITNLGVKGTKIKLLTNINIEEIK